MQLLCNLFFILRRLILILSAVFLSDYPSLQVMLYMALSNLNIIYLLLWRPYAEPLTQRLELFNELCVSLSGLLFLAFTDFV